MEKPVMKVRFGFAGGRTRVSRVENLGYSGRSRTVAPVRGNMQLRTTGVY